MFEMAIDFANLSKADCTPEKLMRLFTKHNMKLSLKPFWYPNGVETDFTTQDSKYFTLVKDVEGNETFDTIYRKNSCIEYHHPGQSDFNDKLWAAIKNVRDNVREWIDYFINNQLLDFDRLDKFLKSHEIKLNAHKLYGDPKLPFVSLTFTQTNIEDQIYADEVVKNLYQDKLKEFDRLRKCPQCGTYFYAKDIRKMFCSNKCRNAAHYKIKNEDK